MLSLTGYSPKSFDPATLLSLASGRRSNKQWALRHELWTLIVGP